MNVDVIWISLTLPPDLPSSTAFEIAPRNDFSKVSKRLFTKPPLKSRSLMFTADTQLSTFELVGGLVLKFGDVKDRRVSAELSLVLAKMFPLPSRNLQS